MSERQGRSRPGTEPVPVITDASSPTSAEHASRVRRYALTMAFRMACFIAAILVDGWLRWVLVAAAVILPYVAVTAANQADQRGRRGRIEPGGPTDLPQLTTGPEQHEVISGVVGDEPADDDGKHRNRKVA